MQVARWWQRGCGRERKLDSDASDDFSSIGCSNFLPRILPRARPSVPKRKKVTSILIYGSPSNSCSTLSCCCHMTAPWRTKTVSRSSTPMLSLPHPLNLSIRTRRTLTYSTCPMDVTAVSASFEMSSVRSDSTDPTGSKPAQLTRRASTCQYRTPGRDMKK